MSGVLSVLLLTGGVATGKNTIAAHIGEILANAGRSFILLDLDELGWAFIPDTPDEFERIAKLRRNNLAAVWPNVQAEGFRHAVISGAISTIEELRPIRSTVGPSLTIVRLVTAPTLQATRLRERDTGPRLDHHQAIMAPLERSMDRSRLEDARVTNDTRPPIEVATTMLERIGWMTSA